MASDLEIWLQSIRLECYFSLFQAAGYTSLLHCYPLVEEDLFKIGIEPPGHRRRILQYLPKAVNDQNFPINCMTFDDEDSNSDSEFKPPLLPPKRISIHRLSVDSDGEISNKKSHTDNELKEKDTHSNSQSESEEKEEESNKHDQPPKPAPRSQRFLLRYHEQLSPKTSLITEEYDSNTNEKLTSLENKPQPLPRRKLSPQAENVSVTSSNNSVLSERENFKDSLKNRESKSYLEPVIENPQNQILDFLGITPIGNNKLEEEGLNSIDLISFDNHNETFDYLPLDNSLQDNDSPLPLTPPLPLSVPSSPLLETLLPLPDFHSEFSNALPSISSIPSFSPPPVPDSPSTSSCCSFTFSSEELSPIPPPIPPRKTEDNHKKLQKSVTTIPDRFTFFLPLEEKSQSTKISLQKTISLGNDVQGSPTKFYIPIQATGNLNESLPNTDFDYCLQRSKASSNEFNDADNNDFPSNPKVESLRGFLYKTGSNQKDFQRRWFLLKQGRLSYYLDIKNEVPKDIIDCEDMKGIVKFKSRKLNQRHCFELITVKDKGRYYLFAADDVNEFHKWVTAITQNFCPPAVVNKVEFQNFDVCGYLYIRNGSGGPWKIYWLILKGKSLNIFHEKEAISEKLDLKKTISLKLITGIGYIETLDDGLYFILDLPGRAMYCQGHLKKVTETWYHILDEAIRESGRNLEEQQLTAEGIPVIVDKCLKFISTHGSTSKGIYRLNGVHSKIVKLLEVFQTDAQAVHIMLEEYCEHDVANMLKRYLRNLPDALMTYKLYVRWIEISVIEDVDEKLQKYKNLLKEKLPDINYKTIKKLVGHLKSIADQSDKNSMTIANLAAIFGPTLMSSERDPVAGSYGMATQEIVVVNDLITYYSTLFEVDQSELDKEKKIQEALERMRLAQLPQKQAGDLILGVYLFGKRGTCLNIKVSPQMTADDLCKYAIEREHLQDNKLTVYEIIFNAELERPLHFTEKILPVTLQWVSWTSDGWTNAAGNFLCIKSNEVYDKVCHMLGPPFSMFSELRFSKGKGFKRFSFEFSRAQLSYYKDARVASPLKTWNVEDIVWYIGVEQKRAAPSKWSLTFLEKGSLIKKSKENPFFGNTICFDREDELYKWIAAMLCAEYPQGVLSTRQCCPTYSFS